MPPLLVRGLLKKIPLIKTGDDDGKIFYLMGHSLLSFRTSRRKGGAALDRGQSLFMIPY